MIDRASLRMSAALLLVGQMLYIVVTQFHAGGAANDHPAIFAVYAGSGIWKAVHVGRFMCAAIFLAGLVVLSFAVNAQAGRARWVGPIRCCFGGGGPRSVRCTSGGGRSRKQGGR
jgi:hypothetical protein